MMVEEHRRIAVGLLFGGRSAEHDVSRASAANILRALNPDRYQVSLIGISRDGAVAELVGIEGGVVSGVINLESSGVEASDWRPRHDEHYHEVWFLAASGRDSFP